MYSFSWHWQKAFFTLLGLSCFIALGLWQLERAHEKEQIVAQAHQLQHQKPMVWDFTPAHPPAFQCMKVYGSFLPTLFFLDNQFYRHRPGYDVLQVFKTTDGQYLLIDRGFIAAQGQNRNLPVVPERTGEQGIEGYVYYPSHKGILLGDWLENHDHDRLLIEKLDMRKLGDMVHHDLKPYIIRLQQKDASLIQDWPVIAMSPERHRGYALQWFVMAFVLVVIYCVTSFKVHK